MRKGDGNIELGLDGLVIYSHFSLNWFRFGFGNSKGKS